MPFDLSSYLSMFAGPQGWGNFGQMSGLDLSQLFGQQQGYIQGMGPNFGNMNQIMAQLQGGGFGAGMDPFISQLQGFRPELAGDVRGTLSGIMQNPWQGAAGGTLQEMLQTGAPVDVSGMGAAAALQGNRALEQLTAGARERAAAGGGLSGSGWANTQGRIGGDIANMMQQAILQSEIGAQEAAQGRRMGALGQHLAGQGLASQTALGLGGLENQLSGQQLQALLGGGQLAGQQGAMDLEAMLGAGGLAESMAGMDLQSQIAQAGAGQDFLSSLPGFAASGAFSGGPMSPHMLAQYIGATGSAENMNQMGALRNLLTFYSRMANNPYINPTNPSSPAGGPGGGGGDFLSALQAAIGGGGGGGGPTGLAPGINLGGGGIPAQPVTPGAGAHAGGGFGWAAPPGVIPPGPEMGSFTPPGEPMPPHPASIPTQPAAPPAAGPGTYSPEAASPASYAPGTYSPEAAAAIPAGPPVAGGATYAGPEGAPTGGAPAGAASVGQMQQNAYARGQAGAYAAGVEQDPSGAYVGQKTGKPMLTKQDFIDNGWIPMSDVAGTTKSGGRWDPKGMYVSPNVNPEEAKAAYEDYLEATRMAESGSNYYGSEAWVARENAINRLQEMGIMHPGPEMKSTPKKPWEQGYKPPGATTPWVSYG